MAVILSFVHPEQVLVGNQRRPRTDIGSIHFARAVSYLLPPRVLDIFKETNQIQLQKELTDSAANVA